MNFSNSFRSPKLPNLNTPKFFFTENDAAFVSFKPAL